MRLFAYTRQDWLLIRSAIIWLGSAMLIVGVLLLATQMYLYFSEQEKLAMRQQVTQTREQADLAQSEWQSVHEHRTEFEVLKRRAIIGAERRLDWIEALTQYQQDHPALDLQYQFAAQAPLPQSEIINQQQIYASAMKISFQAQDENDFSAVNHKLLSLPGLAAPVTCVLQRGEGAGIATQCDYVWLTIAPAKAESEVAQ